MKSWWGCETNKSTVIVMRMQNDKLGKSILQFLTKII